VTALITRPEIYEARTEPEGNETEGILLWGCTSQLSETGVCLRPKYRGYYKYYTDISWDELEERFRITKNLYEVHASIQALLETNDEEEFQPHQILRLCYRQIMEQSKGIESYTPDGGFDSLD
jgi:hypothetical protein